MAPTTRNQTPSTPPSSKGNLKSNASSVVTPDQSNGVDGHQGTDKIPKKRRKSSTNNNVEREKEDAKPAAQKDATFGTPKSSSGVDDQKAPSAPVKKISKPRTKKHKKEKESKFDALFKELEAAKPVAPSTQAPSSIQLRIWSILQSSSLL